MNILTILAVITIIGAIGMIYAGLTIIFLAVDKNPRQALNDLINELAFWQWD